LYYFFEFELNGMNIMNKYRRKPLGDIVDANVVIASSTSGLSMTDIQAECATPERTVVAHPFNPPYLRPLVEMIGGE